MLASFPAERDNCIATMVCEGTMLLDIVIACNNCMASIAHQGPCLLKDVTSSNKLIYGIIRVGAALANGLRCRRCYRCSC